MAFLGIWREGFNLVRVSVYLGGSKTRFSVLYWMGLILERLKLVVLGIFSEVCGCYYLEIHLLGYLAEKY